LKIAHIKTSLLLLFFDNLTICDCTLETAFL
jgi:hypothetical protein